MFKEVPGHFNFAAIEQEVLDFWEANDIFHKSLRQREGKPPFVFYEGPPTANGTPHNGHVLTRVIKDLLPRYKTMRGYYVPRKAGWDTHGLPVETEVEKELGIKGREAIEEYGLEKFNGKCIESVFRYTDVWESLTERIGFWIDLDDAYVTFNRSYVESVWWALSRLFKKGLLYEGYKIIWWWAQGGTALSAAEVGWAYKEVSDPSVYVECPVEGEDGLSLLVWTTTPWTLFDNAFVAVDPELDYVYARNSENGRMLVVAAELLEKTATEAGRELLVEKTVKGKELVGLRYRPPFDYHYSKYSGEKRALKDGGEESPYWRVLAADFVSLDSGTGLVHQAPAFGEEDYELFKQESARFEKHLELFCTVRPNGRFGPEFPEVEGEWVKDADKKIIRLLSERGVLFHRGQYVHNYPFCWRAEEDPLIQYPRKGWFIRTTAEIEKAIENSRSVGWLPEHIKEGRFGEFLENNVDWALSRERFWGTPLNIWVCDKCGKMHAPESVAEIEKLNRDAFRKFHDAKEKDPSLYDNLMVHRPWIDYVTFTCTRDGCGGTMRRVPEVIDCWFDSGSMPFAQWGFPHAEGSIEKFKRAFPADFISEAIDQTRGWFYSLLMISTLVFDEETQREYGMDPPRKFPHPYKNCIVLGHVCDMEGRKESKSKGNYTSPDLVLKGQLNLRVEVPDTGDEAPASGEAFLMPALVRALELGGRERVLIRPANEAIGLLGTAPMLHALLKPGKVAKESIRINPDDMSRMALKPGDVVRVEMPFDPPGADAFRWLFYSSSPPWINTRNSLRAIRDGQKEFLIKLRNVYSFFVIYANIDGFNPAEGNEDASGTTPPHLAKSKGYRLYIQRLEMDRWILSELNIMLRDVVKYMDDYRIYEAARVINSFVESLSNWYLRRSRARFWADGFSQDKLDAYWTLWEALVVLAKTVAPFVPFIAEEIYGNLVLQPFHHGTQPESIHLCDYPEPRESVIHEDLSANMALARKIAALGLSARASKKIKVRQPLAAAHVLMADPGRRDTLGDLLEIVRDELNVKEITFPEDASRYVEYAVKPNFPKIGPRFGKKVPTIKKALLNADASELKAQLDTSGEIRLDIGGEVLVLSSEDVQVVLEAKANYAASGESGVVVVLDVEITDELRSEGLARELVNRIQTARKEMRLDFADRIRVILDCSEKLAAVVERFRDYIMGETLCLELTAGKGLVKSGGREIKIEDETAQMEIENLRSS